jgi:hypothetical protein
VFLKLHHAMVDGVASVELIEVLHSAQPGTLPRPRLPGSGAIASQVAVAIDTAKAVRGRAPDPQQSRPQHLEHSRRETSPGGSTSFPGSPFLKEGRGFHGTSAPPPRS